MTMFWHDKKVALRIVDDVSGRDFDPRLYPDYTVVEVTGEQIANYEKFDAIADKLAVLLDQEPVKRTPEWVAGSKRLHEELFRGFSRTPDTES